MRFKQFLNNIINTVNSIENQYLGAVAKEKKKQELLKVIYSKEEPDSFPAIPAKKSLKILGHEDFQAFSESSLKKDYKNFDAIKSHFKAVFEIDLKSKCSLAMNQKANTAFCEKNYSEAKIFLEKSSFSVREVILASSSLKAVLENQLAYCSEYEKNSLKTLIKFCNNYIDSQKNIETQNNSLLQEINLAWKAIDSVWDTFWSNPQHNSSSQALFTTINISTRQYKQHQ